MKHHIFLASIMLSFLTLSACETAKGVARDIEKGVETVEDALADDE